MSTLPYRPRDAARQVAHSDRILVPGTADAPALTLTCRWPQGAASKAFIVFCHGLGASGRDYRELTSAWAAQGYFVAHPTFPDWINSVAAAEPALGLDPQADLTGWAAMPDIRRRLHEILHTPAYWLERIRIVRRVLDASGPILDAAGVAGGPLPLVIAGHSFGAYTAQLFAGAEIDLPDGSIGRFRDERLAAAILLSAQGRDQQGLREGSWDRLAGPVLTVTGTLDRGAKGQGPDWKSEPFELGPPGAKYLAVLDGADHYLGGMTKAASDPVTLGQRDALKALTLAFLDAHAARDPAAAAWLASVSDRIGPAPLLFKRK